MDNFLQQCADHIIDKELIKKKESVILAVSGGPDSVFLLELFSLVKTKLKNKVIVGHFNHKLRKEADDEEQFVSMVAQKYGFEFANEAKDVKAYYNGDSIEQVARNLRYDFFQKISREFKAKKIVLGHHKDDLMETVLLRIVRGSGLMGLKAMQPLSKYKKLILVRPLLHIEKKDILAYLDTKKIKYAVDKTNFEDIYLRNKIRNKIVPLLTEENPNIKNAFYNLTSSLAMDYDYMHAETVKAYEDILVSHKNSKLTINSNKLATYHPAIVSHLIRHCIHQTKGSLRRIELRHTHEVMDLLRNRPNRSIVDLPDCSVTKQQDQLVFSQT